MEEFLKDSPSDMNPNNNSNGNFNQDENNNNFLLNLDNFNNYSNNNLQLGEDNFLGGNEFNSSQQENLGSSVKSDPFLEDLDSLSYNQHLQSPPQNQPPFGRQQYTQQQQQAPQFNQFLDPSQQTTNLDELISPENDASLGFTSNQESTSFLNPQYFSPPNSRSNFNPLNSIAEDSLSSSFNNSSYHSRHGSISVAPPTNMYNETNNNFDMNAGSYLSPPTNSQFMSPPTNSNYDNSFDTLVSPNYNASGSYLNSPPSNYQSMRVPNNNNLSTSIPNNGLKTNMLSPPNTSGHFGTSAPSTTSIDQYNNLHSHLTNPGVSTKQLTKEEKLKRRREFHNAVERRRRDLIKERIKELGLLVPPSLLNPQLSAVQTLQKSSELNSKEINELLSSIKVKETKPNKSTILNKSVDYINHLKYVLEEQDKAKSNLEIQIKSIEERLGTTTISNDQKNFQSNHQPQQQNFNQGSLGDDFFNPDEFFSDLVATESNQGLNPGFNSNNF